MANWGAMLEQTAHCVAQKQRGRTGTGFPQSPLRARPWSWWPENLPPLPGGSTSSRDSATHKSATYGSFNVACRDIQHPSLSKTVKLMETPCAEKVYRAWRLKEQPAVPSPFLCNFLRRNGKPCVSSHYVGQRSELNSGSFHGLYLFMVVFDPEREKNQLRHDYPFHPYFS